MKLDQNICSNNSSGEFEKHGRQGGGGSCTYMAIVKTCWHYISHIYWPIFMKLGQNICHNEILPEIEAGSYELKN